MPEVTEQRQPRTDNIGVLWKNWRKREERDASSRGDAIIDGVKYWLRGYTQYKDNGEKYVKLYFTKKKIQNAKAP